jgi:hypothetical protein
MKLRYIHMTEYHAIIQRFSKYLCVDLPISKKHHSATFEKFSTTYRVIQFMFSLICGFVLQQHRKLYKISHDYFWGKEWI